MGGYIKTSETYTIKDYYGNHWTQGELTVTVSGNGTTEYTLYMTNDQNVSELGREDDSFGNAISLYLQIGDKLIYNNYIDRGYVTSDGWRYFPTGHDVSETKTISDFTVSGGSLSITFGICCQQSCVGSNSGRWDNGTGIRKSYTLTRDVWTDVTPGDVTIKDHGNNTFSIIYTPGEDGENNKVTGSYVDWGYDEEYAEDNSVLSNIKLPSDEPDKNITVMVYARGATVGKYGSHVYAYSNKSINHYVAPKKKATNLDIEYKKPRFTIKENWTLTWTAPEAANNISFIKGYRIRLFRKRGSVESNLALLSADGEQLSTSTTTDTFYDYDTTSSTPSFIIYTSQYDLKADDAVYFSIVPYTKNGKNETMLDSVSRSTSEAKTIQSAGVIHVKVDNNWHEGQVWVKAGGSWHEAETVNVKVNNAWKESQ